MKVVKLTFKHKDRIIYNASGELTIDGVDNVKTILSKHLNIDKENIDVEIDTYELSNLDVGVYGIHNWDDPRNIILSGVRVNLIEGSDQYLDCLNAGTLENYLEFY
jgi:hypothetical protein